MKHRFINRKTGVEARVMAMYLDSDGVMQVDGYDAVEDLMDDYAAYEEHNPPKEPLIKDEKVRKAVRAWAEAIEEDRVQFDRTSQGFSFSDGNVFSLINFDGFVFDLLDGKKYTIAELCGEEEE